MKFKGTIVITDPCYLDNDMPENPEMKDWWEMVDYGENLEASGIEHYISEYTLYGDWSCHTYKGSREDIFDAIQEWDEYYLNFFREYNNPDYSQEDRDKLATSFRNHKKKFQEEFTLGEFCADAGRVCVVYLEDVLKFNSNFKSWAETHPWCATIIENFDGDVRYEVDEEGDAHIVGEGNVNFYTSQSGF